jgi:DHA1 family bicyclomycin/chloramphenicol resistance-like MFS transporter
VAVDTRLDDTPGPSRTRMIVVLGLLVALGPLSIDMYLPALPRIADELSVSSSVAQLTLTGTLAGLAVGQLIVGPLSDSLGRRRPLMAGIVLHMLAWPAACRVSARRPRWSWRSRSWAICSPSRLPPP